MTAPSIHEKENRPRTVKDRLVLGPTAGDKHRLDARHIGQAFLQQLAAGVEFVIARAVALPARNQHDLGRVGRSARFVAQASRRRWRPGRTTST